MVRTALIYIYLAGLVSAAVVANVLTRPYDVAHPDNAVVFAYLCVAAPLLNIPQVRIEQGRLSLVGIANQAAALLLNPLDATIVGIASSVGTLRRGAFPVLANAVTSACINLVGSLAATEFHGQGALPLFAQALVVGVCSVTNLAVVVLSL